MGIQAIRTYIEKNSFWTTPAAFGLVVVAALTLFLRNRTPSSIPLLMYDLNTKKLIIGDSKKVAPYDAGNGTYSYEDGVAGSAVYAGLFACGDADVQLVPGMTVEDIEAAGGHLLWLRRYPVPLQQALDRMASGEQLTAEEQKALGGTQGALVSDATAAEWVGDEGGRGIELLRQPNVLCGNEKPLFLEP